MAIRSLIKKSRELARWAELQFRVVDAESGALVQSGAPDKQATVVLMTSMAVLILLNYVVLNGHVTSYFAEFFIDSGLSPQEHAQQMELYRRVVWALGCFTVYLVFPCLVCIFVLKKSPRSMGLSAKGYIEHFWIYALMFLPVGLCVVAVSYSEAFQNTYPFYKNPTSLHALMTWELAYALQFISLEFFFRGFMLHGLKHRYGTAAIWIMVIPYCMIHFPKPAAETVGAIIAGGVLGVLSLRTGSVMGGATIHIAVAWLMDTLSLWHKGLLGKLF
jgi:membrane protease YdiL (CAAX protease family)